jgi:glycerophosphoryl diester phosphodiesterase
LGLECLVWTVDRAWAMRRAVRLGADGVITNRPDLLRAVLEAG